MSDPHADVLVTVGMGRFPFDRLVTAVIPLCARWRVVAQTGPSTVVLPCPQRRFLPADELAALLSDVPIVITHAGNTVRMVQQLGKVPIAVARSVRYGEMADDHQVAYVEHERRRGRIIVAEPDSVALSRAVDTFPERAAALLAHRSLPSAAPAEVVADRLDEIVGALVARRRRTRWIMPGSRSGTDHQAVRR